MLQRTAADIVGVPNKKVSVHPVNLLFYKFSPQILILMTTINSLLHNHSHLNSV